MFNIIFITTFLKNSNTCVYKQVTKEHYTIVLIIVNPCCYYWQDIAIQKRLYHYVRGGTTTLIFSSPNYYIFVLNLPRSTFSNVPRRAYIKAEKARWFSSKVGYLYDICHEISNYRRDSHLQNRLPFTSAFIINLVDAYLKMIPLVFFSSWYKIISILRRAKIELRYKLFIVLCTK